MHKLNSFGAFTLLCVACLTIMVGCVIVPGLPAIAAALNVPHAASWLVTLPSLGVAVFGLGAGRVIAVVGARKALLVGLALYGAIGYSCIWLTGYEAVMANRFLLGGATALVMSGGTTLISEFFDGTSRTKMIARQGMAIELGGVVFLAVGGVLAMVSWEQPFALYLIAWLFFGMVLVFVPPGNAHAEDVDYVGSVKKVKMWDIFLAAACSMIAFFAAVILLPTKLAGLGFDEATTGYFLSFVSLVAAGAASLMPRLEGRIGGSATAAVAFVLYAVAHFLFAWSSTESAIALGGVLIGCGFGFSIPLVNHMTIERSPPRQRGHLLGYLSVAIFLGQFMSSFIEMAPVSESVSFFFASSVAICAMIVFLKSAINERSAGRGSHQVR